MNMVSIWKDDVIKYLLRVSTQICFRMWQYNIQYGTQIKIVHIIFDSV